MIQPCPLALPPPRADQPPAPAPAAQIWPQLPAQHRQQALLILAQMLLQAQSPQPQAHEAGHEQPG